MIDYEINKYIYKPAVKLRKVIQDLYQNKVDICLVCQQKNRLDGIITLGDIKSAVVNGLDPSSPISSVMNRKFVSAQKGTTDRALAKMSKTPLGARRIPVVDRRGNVTGVYPKDANNHPTHKRVLVTGGAGYVGSIVCRQLLSRGYKVVALDNLLFGKKSIADILAHKNFRLIVGDISNINNLIQGIKEVDHVIHLAGTVGDPASLLDPNYTMESNYFSTHALIELSKHYQISHFVFASSCSVYGAGPGVLNESSPLNPVSLYARTKIAAEKKLLEDPAEHFNPIILRFGTLYGLSPRMRFDLVANIMTAHAFFFKKISVQGGDQWRPLLHVADAARACVEMLESPLAVVKRQVFNVGAEKENYRIKDIAILIRKQLPKTQILSQDTAGDGRDYRVSFKKISQKTGFAVKYTLARGIAELIKSMKKGRFKDFTDSQYSNYLQRKESSRL